LCPPALPAQDIGVARLALSLAIVLAFVVLSRAPEARADAATANLCAPASERAIVGGVCLVLAKPAPRAWLGATGFAL
jgi:hypothetical protein